MNEIVNLKVCVYQLDEGEMGVIDVRLERVGQREDDDLWAIREKGFCLNRAGNWEYEPMPSSRSVAFIRRCRWPSAEDALAFWRKNGCKSRLEHYRRVEG